MSLPPPEYPKRPVHDVADVATATSQLFVEISATIADAELRMAVASMNERMALSRQYESVLIPNLEEEYQALSDCWHNQDMPRLKTLLLAYFKRRRDLAPQIAKMINRPN